MQPSPYTPGAIASELPGRDHQLAEFDERLSLMADLRQFVGRPRIDIAPRGVGKTSMLAQVRRMAEQRGAVTVWVAGGGSGSLIADLVAQLEAATESWAPTTRRKLHDLASRASFKVGVGVPGVARAEAEIAAPHTAETSVPAGAGEFTAFLAEAAAATQREHRSGLVLFIDEIQDADQSGLSSFAHGWQNLQHLPGQGPAPAAVFAAGLPNSDSALRAAASFTERWDYQPLGLLSQYAAIAALVRPAQRLGVGWGPDVLQAAVEYAEGFPFTLQLLGDAAWRAAGRPDPGGQITLANAMTAQGVIATDLATLHRARWNAATPAEQTFLQAMADIGGSSVSRAEIASRLHVASRSLSEHRERLIVKGIIRVTGHGRLGFTINGFGDYLRSRAED
ncbi:ATP-binding protein [Leekyejoonella antrihumi]|uniref:ATP-binding protein n=1 Tax=Leekyejoonella antrihumi TaxID=1660198 RepID=A0A563E1X8_9MICO|nr:ATP-binding protein [Leekyejoonella antrihumi]TWP36211.1 ATP-binding protein [Leekyejoonella antrihumi]